MAQDPDKLLRDASRGIRLHKALADAGVASRRAAEQLIAEGRVAVNGRVVRSLPAFVDPAQDRIEVDGSPIAKPARRSRIYLMVHKPRRTICTNRDPEGRATIFHLVPHKQRLFCVGRLDFETTGLVLLTDDGDLANRLMHPRYETPQTFEVHIKGTVAQPQLDHLLGGMYFKNEDGRSIKARAAAARIMSQDADKSRLEIQMPPGQARELRRMLLRVDLNVKSLKRMALGPLRLKGVPVGGWRDLTRDEVATLRKFARQ
jgi:pseudouridine synthase